METRQMLNCVIENEDEGIIFIGRDGIIQEINKAAERILGISLECKHFHEAGRLENGDIVIIADTEIGEDDGNLAPSDLIKINIVDGSIKPHSILVAMGVYGEREDAVYKFATRNGISTKLSVRQRYRGHEICSSVDLAEKKASIHVDDKIFDVDFINSYGHIVIVDGDTGRIKFFQDRGYTIRKEYIKDILEQKTFLAKGTQNLSNVKGQNFWDYFEAEDFKDEMSQIFSGTKAHVTDVVYEVNKRALLVSMQPVKDEKVTCTGVMLKLTEIGDLESLLKKRNRVIDIIEEKKKKDIISKSKAPEVVFSRMIGDSTQMQKVKQLIYKAAKIKCNVLITGESGTGKSLLAKEIYNATENRGPYVAVDCSTISPTLFESEMFGYVKGAFTGADPKGKEGFFEAANGGTIFLDEIGEIPTEIQAKLLSVIQNKEIYRVGSTKPIPISVRIIAATNKQLLEEVEKGNFRKDLYYRLNVFSIEIPPLRSCKEDMYYLSQEFLKQACKEYEMEEKVLANEAVYKILSYDWPGNVRELENVLKRAVAFCEDDVIFSEYINIPVDQRRLTLKEKIKAEEKKLIERTLISYNNDKKAAMVDLGLSKSVFYAKLNEYGIK